MDVGDIVNWGTLLSWIFAAVIYIGRLARGEIKMPNLQRFFASNVALGIVIGLGLAGSATSTYLSYTRHCNGVVRFTKNATLTEVRGRTFVNERVQLDGKRFTHCTFQHVTLVYNGTAPLGMDNNLFNGPSEFYTDNDSIFAALILMKGVGVIPREFTVYGGEDREPAMVEPPIRRP